MINDFARGYIACALWLLDDDPPSGQYEGNEKYEIEDIEDSTLKIMLETCERFQRDNAAPLAAAYAVAGYTEARAGHDLWLSRNGHGAGYFDRGLPTGDLLQNAARKLGNLDIYEGDDGKVYG